ncbi:hypothetical protein Mapa_002674 [Marchantia paleacea]|nr:hypothetical protein Mapa_002674 [Marchantia paleacea]
MNNPKLQEQDSNFSWYKLYQIIGQSLEHRSSGCYVCFQCRLLALILAQHLQEVHEVHPNVYGTQDQARELAFHVPVDPEQFDRQECLECNEASRGEKALQKHIFLEHSVIELMEGDDEFDENKRHFIKKWTVDPPDAGSETLRVDRILKLNNFWNGRAEKFELYKTKLMARRADVGAGEESLAFHGTTFVCDNDRRSEGWELCGNPGGICGVCGIIEHGLMLCKAKQPGYSFQRYGPGIYSTPISSKSDNYVKQSGYKRAIFLCKVLLGKAFKTPKSRMEDLTAPPEGYDSVWGIARSGPGNHLNYDEFVVYDSDAILPTHIIIYHKQLEVDHNWHS